jgi:hypothetical protein
MAVLFRIPLSTPLSACGESTWTNSLETVFPLFDSCARWVGNGNGDGVVWQKLDKEKRDIHFQMYLVSRWLRQNCAGELSLVESSYCGSEVSETAWMDRLAVEGFSGV